jgi:APA family basic amino acid/polyamine antiporter
MMANRLPRRIPLWSAAAILVGTTIGSGIFRSPAAIADRLPAVLPLLGVWVTGGVLALCGALTLAEVSGAFPDTGGIYVFIREGWGRLPAFLFGWAELVIIRAAALGAIATAFAEYLLRSLGRDSRVAPYDSWVHYIAAAGITAVGCLNYWGVGWGTLLQNVLTLIKCGGLLTLILLAVILGGQHLGMYPTPGVVPGVLSSAASGSLGITSFGLALVSVLWVYDGWADVSFVAGEVQDPARNLPRVLILGTLLIIVIYVLANVAYVTVLPLEELRHSKLVAADVAYRLIGQSGVVAIGFIVMLSTFGTLNGSMLTGPRILWAMAHDGLLFKPLASVHQRYETPHVAIAVTSVLGIAFVSFRSFEQLANTFVTASIPFYALAVASVFPLRRRTGYAPRFRTIGYPVTPVLFISATLYLLANALTDPVARRPTAAVFAVILAGVPIYWGVVKNRPS